MPIGHGFKAEYKTPFTYKVRGQSLLKEMPLFKTKQGLSQSYILGQMHKAIVNRKWSKDHKFYHSIYPPFISFVWIKPETVQRQEMWTGVGIIFLCQDLTATKVYTHESYEEVLTELGWLLWSDALATLESLALDYKSHLNLHTGA